MKKILFFASLFSSCIFITTANAATVEDGEFNAWNSFSFVTDDPYVQGPPPNVSTGNAVRAESGGNPGAYFKVTHTFTTGDTVSTGGIKTDFSYNPSTKGAIQDISVTADLLHPSGGSTAWQLVLEQAGQRYYSFPFGVFSNHSWSTVGAAHLASTDFDTNPWAGMAGILPDGNAPDFSSAADPLRFGLMFGNRVIGHATITNTLGLDNFSVSVSPVPEPPAFLLLTIGLTLLFYISRRRTMRFAPKYE